MVAETFRGGHWIVLGAAGVNQNILGVEVCVRTCVSWARSMPPSFPPPPLSLSFSRSGFFFFLSNPSTCTVTCMLSGSQLHKQNGTQAYSHIHESDMRTDGQTKLLFDRSYEVA